MSFPVKGESEFVEFFNSLDKTNPLYKKVDAVLETLADNPYAGDRIRFELIPKQLKTKYGIENLCRIEINRSWRLLYTVFASPQDTKVIVLMAMDHKNYDRLFKY